MKRTWCIIAAVLLAASTVFANGGKDSAQSIRIGVSMPTKDLQRWSQDGANIKALLEKNGYKVDLQHANNNIAAQAEKVGGLLAKR